jgi:hypothetical protein
MGPTFTVPSDDTAGTRNQRRDELDILALDESWFCYITDNELIWFPPDGKVPPHIPPDDQKATWGQH